MRRQAGEKSLPEVGRLRFINKQQHHLCLKLESKLPAFSTTSLEALPKSTKTRRLFTALAR
jgi:hypothetical protein